MTLPLFVVLAFGSAFGAGLWLSALNVKYRDFRYVIPFIVQFGLYVSPVGFSSDKIPENWRLLYSLNPMVGVIDGFRWALLRGETPLVSSALLTSVLITAVLCVSGSGTSATPSGRLQTLFEPEIRSQRSDVRDAIRLNSAKELDVYKMSYKLAMQIFALTKRFPAEEKFALISQIRRSSRSVCLNLREAWAKRRYEAHFLSKLTDCDGENSETDSSIDFARDCAYITVEQHKELANMCQQVGKMLGTMINNPAPFLIFHH